MKANEAKVMRGGPRSRFLGAGASLLLGLALSGCGETNPLNPNPQPTPTPAPTRANVAMALTGIRLETDSRVPGYINSLIGNLRLTESGGVAATIDFIRLDMYLPNNTLLERTQLLAAQVPGGAALAANSSRDFADLALGFNSDILTGRYIIVSVSLTDARGNAQVTSTGQLVFG